MEGKRSGKEKFLGIYLWIALLFGIIGIVDGILNFTELSLRIYSLVMGLLVFVFFFFNLFSWVHFMHDKLEKITWVLPTYHLVSYILFFVLGIFMGLKGLLTENSLNYFVVISIVTSVLEISWCVYLLKRFKFL